MQSTCNRLTQKPKNPDAASGSRIFLSNLILFNKPYGVMSQFSGGQPNLSRYITEKGYYPAGRLDKDSEGLLLLTNDGLLQSRISDPRFKMAKVYLVQVEGQITDDALSQLRSAISLKDGRTRRAGSRRIETAPLPDRVPPIRVRAHLPTSWLELSIREGRNRQVRRMTATVGFPTLRLFRLRIGPWQLEGLEPGEYRLEQVNLPNR